MKKFITKGCHCPQCGFEHENKPYEIIKRNSNLIFFRCKLCGTQVLFDLLKGAVDPKSFNPNSQWFSGSKGYWDSIKEKEHAEEEKFSYYQYMTAK